MNMPTSVLKYNFYNDHEMLGVCEPEGLNIQVVLLLAYSQTLQGLKSVSSLNSCWIFSSGFK